MTPHTLIGKKAPSVTLKDSNNDDYELNPGSKGLPIAVFFYPASGTYGCTREACEFRDAITTNDSFKRSGVEVIGISHDAVQKQRKFVDDNKLGYPILSDVEGLARKAFQVPKGFFGLTEGRVTFCIDREGIVREVFDSVVNFREHTKFVDKWLAKLPPKKEATDAAKENGSAAEESTANGDAPKAEEPKAAPAVEEHPAPESAAVPEPTPVQDAPNPVPVEAAA